MMIEINNRGRMQIVNLDTIELIFIDKTNIEYWVKGQNGFDSEGAYVECLKTKQEAQARYEEIKKMLIPRKNILIDKLDEINDSICELYSLINGR